MDILQQFEYNNQSNNVKLKKIKTRENDKIMNKQYRVRQYIFYKSRFYYLIFFKNFNKLKKFNFKKIFFEKLVCIELKTTFVKNH